MNGYNFTIKFWDWNYPTQVWVPVAFLMIDCILLLIALLWILNSLRYEKQARGNEKWMGIHTALLTITLGS
jgi:hypothetical protein